MNEVHLVIAIVNAESVLRNDDDNSGGGSDKNVINLLILKI